MEWIDILISLVLALIMFGIGASLKLEDFRTIFSHRKPLVTGLTLQMLFLPALALVVAMVSGLSPELKMGLFIIAICPGGTTSNFISYITRADTALSVALTSVNSIMILVTIPLLSSLAFAIFLPDAQKSISVLSTSVQVFSILIVPVVLGVLFHEKMPRLSETLQTPLKYFNTLLLAFVFAIKYFANESAGGSGIQMQEVWSLLPACLGLHLGGLFISFIIARRLKIDLRKSTTIGIEVGLQNTTLALLVAGTLIGNNEMTKPTLVYSMFSFFTTLLFAMLILRGVGRRLHAL